MFEILETSKQREVYLIGDIQTETMRKITEAIIQLHQEAPNKEITLYITSGGGAPHLALGFYELIRIKKIPLTTVAVGDCSSSALIVLLAGSNRKTTQNTLFEIHEIIKRFSEETQFSQSEIESMTENTRKLGNTLLNIVTEVTGKKIEEIRNLQKRNISLTAKEAKKLNLIREII